MLVLVVKFVWDSYVFYYLMLELDSSVYFLISLEVYWFNFDWDDCEFDYM